MPWVEDLLINSPCFSISTKISFELGRDCKDIAFFKFDYYIKYINLIVHDNEYVLRMELSFPMSPMVARIAKSVNFICFRVFRASLKLVPPLNSYDFDSMRKMV